MVLKCLCRSYQGSNVAFRFLGRCFRARLFVLFQTHLENICEARDDTVFDLAHLKLAPQQFLHRSDGLALASDDEIEEAEVCVDVESEAVCRHPACDVDADGGDLARSGMHAGQSLDAKALNTEIRDGAHQDFFQITYVAVNVLALRAQVDDRIADELAQAVIGDFTSAIGLEDGDAALFNHILRHEYASGLCAAPEGQRVRVLDEKQRVGLVPAENAPLGLLLDGERRAVLKPAQASDS